MGNVFEDYIKQETERMKETPNMIVNPTDRWVILEESSDNIEKFYLYMSKLKISLEDVRVYCNDTETYFKISEGIKLRNELEKERERQRELENPTVELDINNKDELIDYILEELYDLEHSLIYEYSTDMELDEVKLNAKHAKLLELSKKYL